MADKRAQLRQPPKAPVERSAGISTIDLLDRVLDKGIVVDYWARISVLGIDVLTNVKARVVVASLDTYLHRTAAIKKVRNLPGLASR